MEASAHGGDARRLADFLRARHDGIVALWEAEIRRQRPARALSRPVLLDHIPDFLRQLSVFVDELREGHVVPPPQEFPVIHALERLDLGYDLTEVVGEYSVLRRCIIEMALREESPAVRSAQMPRLHEALDLAISASVNRYAQARERTLKALDRISTAALGSHDLESFLPKTLAVLLETTAAVDAVSVLLVEDGVLRVRASVGFALTPQEAAPLRPGECFAGRVWLSGQPILIRDASSDPTVTTDTVRKRETHALYGVPLHFGTQPIGVALMGSCSTFEFSHEDLLLFRTAASRAAALVAQGRLDAELKRQNKLYETMLTAQSDVGEGFVLVEEGKIAYTNDAFCRMIGCTAAEIKGRPALDLVFPDTREALADRRTRAATAKAPDVFETRLLHREGHPVEVEAAVQPLDERRVVAICRDITTRKEAERELQAGIDFRDRLMSVLSHDLRQPLSVVTTSAAMLLERKELAPHAPVLERQLRNARRMDRMIRDLLDYTRTHHGHGLTMHMQAVNAADLIRQALDGMQALHPDRMFRLQVDGDCAGRWDGDRLLQVFSNLLANAVAYSPARSSIDVTLQGEGPQVVFAFRNSGPPIPQEKLATIFEPFRRADLSANPEGLGLGLYIVQEIVAAHGGSVSVRSDAQEGTTFEVRLPREGEE